MTDREQVNAEGRVLLRVAKDMREFLTPAAHEPEAASLLRDVETVERVGRWLAGVVPIAVTDGIPTAGSTERPSIPTYREARDTTPTRSPRLA